MNARWQSALQDNADIGGASQLRTTLALAIVLATVFFNLVLCFVNTKLSPITPTTVIGTEMTLLFMAFGLIWDRSRAIYLILICLLIYFAVIMTFRNGFDPKIVRDILIPIVFFFVGLELGDMDRTRRMVRFLIWATLAGSLFEWLATDTFLQYFDVINYYVARGTVSAEDFAGTSGLFINGTRPDDARNLLPFLGDHRVSGIFLEPLSTANFGIIAFIWMFLCDRQHWGGFIIRSLAIMAAIVLADGRFGFYFCFLVLLLHLVQPLVRPVVLFVLPFVAMGALWIISIVNAAGTPDNTIGGRLLSSGIFMSKLSVLDVFGLTATDGSQMADSGYAYLLSQAGLVGFTALWALFIFAPIRNPYAREYRNCLAFYFIILLSVGVSILTIKVEALAWFLFGTLASLDRAGQPVHRSLDDERARFHRRRRVQHAAL